MAIIFVQVAVAAAMLTEIAWLALAPPVASAAASPIVAAAVEPADCKKATWPNIPRHCLERIDAKLPNSTMVLSLSN